MSDQDQLERDVEAALARLATNGVPDTERPPAPPWQQRRRPVDARRFGRATPWLVAAVLLVIAGLGVGAVTTFDAKGPERGPVGSNGPSPTGIATDGNGTLGDPTGTPTPRSTPSFSRDSNTAPNDGLGTLVASTGGFGPITAGMTEAEAVTALGGNGSFTAAGSCSEYLDDASGMLVRAVDGVVVGVIPPAAAEDADGNGKGTQLAQLRASYPDGTLAESSSGWVFSVVDGADGLGFILQSSVTPVDTDPVSGLRPGTVDFARGFELCSG